MDIDWNFSDLESLLLNLIDEFTRILHAIHAEKYFHDHSSTKHSISIVCVSELHSRDYKSEYFASPEENPTKEWHIRIRLHDES